MLDVPHIQQETLLCVPTSAAMVLRFYGDHQEPRRLKALATGRAYDATAFNDFSITYYRDQIRGLRTLGYEWRELAFSDGHADFERGIALIESELLAGRPVLVDVSIPSGHTFVIRGFDRDKRMLHVVDPAQAWPGRYAVSYAQFEGAWNEHAYGGQFRSLMLTRARAES